mgnify:FL=1
MCNCNLDTTKNFDCVNWGDISLEFDHGHWYITWGCWDEFGSEEVFYCPKCGRKLIK